jgi:hypothetical protein
VTAFHTAAAAAAVCGAVVVFPAAARADISYTGHAEAHGVRLTATNPAFPLNFVVEGDAPITTADLSSLGDSRSLAAGPYPGTTAAAAPGTVGGLFGLPVPNYPVVATATAGDDPVEQDLPGLSLRAVAGADRSEGRAIMGSGGQGAQTLAAVDASNRTTSGVSATATSRVEGLAFLDFLHVQRVLSSAATVLDPEGKRSSHSDLRIDGISAPGLTFTVPPQTPGQIPLPDPAPGLPQPPPLVFAPLPVPGAGSTFAGPELGFRNGDFVVTTLTGGVAQHYPVPFATVATAFDALGWKVAFFPALRTDTGIVGATLTFRSELAAPPPNPFGVDQATPVTMELGRVATSVDGRSTTTPDLTQSGLGPAGIDQGPALTGGIPGLANAPVAPDGSAPAVPAPDTVPPPAQTVMTMASGTAASSPFTDLYGLFVVVAAVVLLAAPLAIVVGSRLR